MVNCVKTHDQVLERKYKNSYYSIFKPVSHNTIRDKINVGMAEKHANYTKDITLGVKR